MTRKTNHVRISSAELGTWMDEDRSFLLLDVLPPAAFGHRRLPGAKNACVFETAFPDLVRAAGADDPSAPIVVYGEDSETRDADTAARKLLRMGFTDVRILAEGFRGWRSKGLPVDGSEGDPPDHKPLPPDGTYLVAPDESMLEWTGRNARGRHTGTMDFTRGTLRVEGGRMSGEFAFDPRTLRNTDLEDASLARALVDHLLSDDFLFADRHPEILFTIRQSKPLENAAPGAVNCHLRGKLAMRGRIETLVFPAVVAPRGKAVAVEAHFDLDRTRWGMLYGSGRFFRHLGKHLVHDVVSIQLRMVCRP